MLEIQWNERKYSPGAFGSPVCQTYDIVFGMQCEHFYGTFVHPAQVWLNLKKKITEVKGGHRYPGLTLQR